MAAVTVSRISDQGELEAAFSIRRNVFVGEQGVDPREEYDEFENGSTHFLATVEGKPAGTARWRKTSKGYKLERFAVLPEFRRRGVGAALVREVLKDIPADGSQVYLNSQLDARKLYEKFGFVQEGEEFLEAGIRHYKMVLSNQK